MKNSIDIKKCSNCNKEFPIDTKTTDVELIKKDPTGNETSTVFHICDQCGKEMNFDAFCEVGAIKDADKHCQNAPGTIFHTHNVDPAGPCYFLTNCPPERWAEAGIRNH